MVINRKDQLENTLLKADYPEIRAARIDIPEEQLDDYQKAMFERSLGKKIVYDGIEYCLVGASAPAKDGKYYAVVAVKDHDLGTNDRHNGWIRRSMFERLGLPAGCFCQFRMSLRR
jgi:hypothetical protein